MLLLIFFPFLIFNFSMLKCDEQFEKLGNLTIKYGNTTEIHFKIKDTNTKSMKEQLEAIRWELQKMEEKLDKLSLGHSTFQYPKNCLEATAVSRRSGVYQIQVPAFSQQPWVVSCDENTQGGGWIVIMRRMDGSIKFYRDWKDYKHGFGNVNGEFFMGFDKIHALTKDRDQELLIEMENWAGVKKFVKYDQFVIDNEEKLYTLSSLGEYSGDGGNSLDIHLNMPFSARDRDNDNIAGNCSKMYLGGWWYNNCHASNLMGKYNETTYGKGINWDGFNGLNDSLKRVQMMIRIRDR